MIISTIQDGAKITTNIEGKFDIASDQPHPYGEDTAPAPFDIFLAGVSACAAYFAQRYCRKWNLSHDGISVELEPVFDTKHVLTDVKMKLKVPTSFPKEHHAGLLRNAGACPVKKALETPPALSLDLIEV